MDVFVKTGLTVPAAELQERFSRSSGPGGQGVNTADSRVELRFDVATSPTLTDAQKTRLATTLENRLHDGALVIVASEFRTQLANRKAARQRLGQLLREGLAPPARKRRPTKPTKGSVERRIHAKKQRGHIKEGRGRVRGE